MKHKSSLTARLAALFAAMASGLLIVVVVLIDRSVSAHFDELDLYDLSAKRVTLEALLSNVNTLDSLDRLPSRINDAFVGRDSVALLISIPEYHWQYALLGERFDPIQSDFSHANQPFFKWKTADGSSFMGQAVTLYGVEPDSTEVNVSIGLDISHHVHFLEDLRLYLGIGIAAATFLAAMLGWFAAHKGLAPMRKVASAARRLSAKSLGERLSKDDVPTEMQELVDAFNGMLERLEASFRRLNEFSDDIAHELRSPVSNLMTETHVALSLTRSAEEYREVLHSNLEEFDRLARMIADMLFLAKAENEMLPMPLKTIALETEVMALFEFYEALADEKNLQLTLEGQGKVHGDQLMLRRALSNLLSNAIRHTPATKTIYVKIQQGSKDVILSISNPGDAIPAEQISLVFERFHRVDPSRKRQGDGAGLGLSITRSIIHAHGGKISLESNSTSTIFTLTLPAHRPTTL